MMAMFLALSFAMEVRLGSLFREDIGLGTGLCYGLPAAGEAFSKMIGER